jgi:hypothetical protein
LCNVHIWKQPLVTSSSTFSLQKNLQVGKAFLRSGPRFRELDPHKHCPDGAHIGDCPAEQEAVGQSADNLHEVEAGSVDGGGADVDVATTVELIVTGPYGSTKDAPEVSVKIPVG